MAKGTLVLDQTMKEAVDVDSSEIVRTFIWNAMMGKNNHSTDKTVEEMKPVLDMSDDEVRQLVKDLQSK